MFVTDLFGIESSLEDAVYTSTVVHCSQKFSKWVMVIQWCDLFIGKKLQRDKGKFQGRTSTKRFLA